MGGMIKYEWKRYGKQTNTNISYRMLFIFDFCVYSSIIQITAIDQNGQTVSGMQAVEVLKDTQQRQELTQDRVNEIVNQYLEYANNPDTNSNNEAYHYLSEEKYRTFYQSNRELLSLISNVYKEPGSSTDIKDVFEENVGKDFIQARLERDQKYIQSREERGQLMPVEADYWEREVEKYRNINMVITKAGT